MLELGVLLIAIGLTIRFAAKRSEQRRQAIRRLYE